MEDILKKIESCKDYERAIFGAQLVPFNDRMKRWNNDSRPDVPNNNFFEPAAGITASDITVLDIEAAIAFQEDRGLKYLMIQTEEPLDSELEKAFGFEKECTIWMVLLNDCSKNWKENNALEIKDIQSEDISEDLLDVSDVPEKYRKLAYKNMQRVLQVAKEHPEYHWLCGYLEGRKVASGYALCHEGCFEMDDLWVDEEYRHQYLATTMMKYLAKNFDGIFYLHADDSRTPKEMYARMGFETVKRTYEYYMEWEVKQGKLHFVR